MRCLLCRQNRVVPAAAEQLCPHCWEITVRLKGVTEPVFHAIVSHLQKKYRFAGVPGQFQVGDPVALPDGRLGTILDDQISVELVDGTTTVVHLKGLRHLP